MNLFFQFKPQDIAQNISSNGLDINVLHKLYTDKATCCLYAFMPLCLYVPGSLVLNQVCKISEEHVCKLFSWYLIGHLSGLYSFSEIAKCYITTDQTISLPYNQRKEKQ